MDKDAKEDKMQTFPQKNDISFGTSAKPVPTPAT